MKDFYQGNKLIMGELELRRRLAAHLPNPGGAQVVSWPSYRQTEWGMADEKERKVEWWRQKRWWVAVLLVAIGLLVLVTVVPPRLIHMRQPDTTGLSAGDRAKIQAQFETDRTKAENDLRTSLVTMLAGVAVAAGTVVAALSLRETQRQNRLSRRLDRDQLELTRRGQVTERFSQAIEQLGHEKLDVRIGAIYALEQIARDTRVHGRDRSGPLGKYYGYDKWWHLGEDPAGDLHWPIVEILTAFIREHTKADAATQTRSEQPEHRDEASKRRVAADIQAALTVLGRRNLVGDRDQLDLDAVDIQRADLSHANLQGAKFHKANLQGANLDKADLHEASLDGANLQDASLRVANLEKANLGAANLQRANLGIANLEAADLGTANLQGADLGTANLKRANLRAADLRGANLERAALHFARLDGGNLQGANLRTANLEYANLKAADLGTANLQGANLYNTNLQEANLNGANLHDARLEYAYLEGVDLSETVELTQEQLDSATCDEETKPPPALTVNVKATADESEDSGRDLEHRDES